LKQNIVAGTVKLAGKICFVKVFSVEEVGILLEKILLYNEIYLKYKWGTKCSQDDRLRNSVFRALSLHNAL